MSRIKSILDKTEGLENKYPQYEHKLESKFVQAITTNTIENIFYTSEEELLKETTVLHKLMSERDPELMTKTIVYGREQAHMRLQPIFGLAYLSTIKDKSWFKKAFSRIIRTPKDLLDFIEIISTIRSGRGLGRAIKKEINNWLNNLSEYHAIKYGSNIKGEWSLADVIRATHPNTKEEEVDLIFKYLVSKVKNKDHLTQDELNKLPKIKEFENLKKVKERDKIKDAINKGRLPHEVVTSMAPMDKEMWKEMIPNMPYFATLRHLATLERNGVFNDKKATDNIIDRLINKEAIGKSKVLPFIFYSAYKKIEKQEIKEAIGEAIETSLDNMPQIEGSTAVFLDISASMEQRYKEAGAILGSSILRKCNYSVDYKLFHNLLVDIPLNGDESVIEIVDKSVNMGTGGTNIGACISHLLGKIKDLEDTSSSRYSRRFSDSYNKSFRENHKNTEPEKFDNIIIITDEQQNEGSPLIRNFKEYKGLYPDSKLFIINVTPHSAHTFPEEEKNVYYIRGWSEAVINHISTISKGNEKQMNEVQKVRL